MLQLQSISRENISEHQRKARSRVINAQYRTSQVIKCGDIALSKYAQCANAATQYHDKPRGCCRVKPKGTGIIVYIDDIVG